MAVLWKWGSEGAHTPFCCLQWLPAWTGFHCHCRLSFQGYHRADNRGMGIGQLELLQISLFTVTKIHPFFLNKYSPDCCLCVCSVAQSCQTLCASWNCSPPVSPVHGIFQARILEWFAMPSSRGSSWPTDRTHASYVCCIDRWVLYHWTTFIVHPQTIQPFNFQNSGKHEVENFDSFLVDFFFWAESFWRYLIFNFSQHPRNSFYTLKL